LRLALAAALAQAAVRGAQCLILDEPFAFFDRGRMRETLAGLPSVSDRLTQIWVISQEFEPNAGFTLEIQCAPDQDTLTVKAA
jgi:DNA repair exonuclease SbcCD ATPase subunit